MASLLSVSVDPSMWGDFNSGGKRSDDGDRLLRQELKKRRIMAEGLAACNAGSHEEGSGQRAIAACNIQGRNRVGEWDEWKTRWVQREGAGKRKLNDKPGSTGSLFELFERRICIKVRARGKHRKRRTKKRGGKHSGSNKGKRNKG